MRDKTGIGSYLGHENFVELAGGAVPLQNFVRDLIPHWPLVKVMWWTFFLTHNILYLIHIVRNLQLGYNERLFFGRVSLQVYCKLDLKTMFSINSWLVKGELPSWCIVYTHKPTANPTVPTWMCILTNENLNLLFDDGHQQTCMSAAKEIGVYCSSLKWTEMKPDFLYLESQLEVLRKFETSHCSLSHFSRLFLTLGLNLKIFSSWDTQVWFKDV